MSGTPSKSREEGLRGKLGRAAVIFMAGTGITVLLVVGIAEFLSTERGLDDLEGEIRRGQMARGRNLVENHADVFRSLVRDTALTEMHSILSLTVSGDDVVYGLYTDEEGKPWGYCSPHFLCEPSEGEAPPVVRAEDVAAELMLPLPLPQDRIPQTRDVSLSQGLAMEFSHPIFVDGQPEGTLRYGISAQGLREALSSARQQHRDRLRTTLTAIALILSGALALGLWVARRTAEKITRPLRELTSAAARLASGDRSAQVKISSGDELETLGDTFNKMVEDLEGSYSKLQAKNVDLEREMAEKRLAQDERSEIQEHLIQSQKMEAFGQLAGGVAHDFNNILAVILGNAEMANDELSETKGDEVLNEHLHEMTVAAKRGANLTRQLLTFARRETERTQVVDVNSVLMDFEKLLRRVLEESVRVVVERGEGLCKVCMDPGRLEQVLMNLCVNARDAMPGGGELVLSTEGVLLNAPLETRTGELAPGKYILVSAKDTGQGMSEEVLKRIFEPFFTTKASGQGTGLGLATVHGIVKGADGAIDVQSTLGEGTQFFIYLPACEGAKMELAEKLIEPTRAGEGRLVLLCEDDEAVRKMTQRVLRSAGYEVIATESGQEALALLPSVRFSALVTDVVMPNMDGSQLAARAREIDENLPILFLSGYTAGVLLSHGVSDEAINFLRKPFQRDELLREVDRVIKSRSSK